MLAVTVIITSRNHASICLYIFAIYIWWCFKKKMLEGWVWYRGIIGKKEIRPTINYSLNFIHKLFDY